MRGEGLDRFAVRLASPVRPLRCETAGAVRRFGRLGKGGTTGWTVGKLVTLILLVVVLVLVIYGYSTGAINPLKEKIIGMYDGVLIMFGIGDDGGGGECSNFFLVNTGDGIELLNVLGLSESRRSDVTASICTDGRCRIMSTGMGDYQLVGDDLEVRNDGSTEWEKVAGEDYGKKILLEKVDDMRFYNAFYWWAKKELEKKIGVEDVVEFSREYGASVSMKVFADRVQFAYWNRWGWKEINDGIYKNEDAMFDAFLEEVDNTFDDKIEVRYVYDDSKGDEVKEIKGVTFIGNKNDEIEGEAELKEFREAIESWKNEAYFQSLRRKPSEDLKEEFDGEAVSFKGVDYSVSIDEDYVGVRVIFEEVLHPEKKYALVYFPYPDSVLKGGYYFMESDSDGKFAEGASEGRFTEEDFDKIIFQDVGSSKEDVVGNFNKRSRIYAFLKGRCRS